jgi:hypothetical protein
MPNRVHAVVTAKDEEGLWCSFPRFALGATGQSMRNRWT